MGAGIIFAACVLLAVRYAHYRNSLFRQLKGLISLVEITEGELRYSSTLLWEIFDRAVPRLDPCFENWLNYLKDRLVNTDMATFAEIWADGEAVLFADTFLMEAYGEYVEELGGVLNYLDVTTQLSRIEYLKSKLMAELDRLKEDNARNIKLAYYICILAGAFLVILLW